MRPLVKYWRSEAISIVVYLDNGISAAQSFSKCEEHSLVVGSDLFQSGFVPNKDKCQWVPIQVICLMGIFWDFKNNSMFIPLEKISGIFDEMVLESMDNKLLTALVLLHLRYSIALTIRSCLQN